MDMKAAKIRVMPYGDGYSIVDFNTIEGPFHTNDVPNWMLVSMALLDIAGTHNEIPGIGFISGYTHRTYYLTIRGDVPNAEG
jgi:hypothetical protein